MDRETARRNINEHLDNKPRSVMYVGLSGTDANIVRYGRDGHEFEEIEDMLAALIHHISLETGAQPTAVAAAATKRAKEMRGEL